MPHEGNKKKQTENPKKTQRADRSLTTPAQATPISSVNQNRVHSYNIPTTQLPVLEPFRNPNDDGDNEEVDEGNQGRGQENTLVTSSSFATTMPQSA